MLEHTRLQSMQDSHDEQVCCTYVVADMLCHVEESVAHDCTAHAVVVVVEVGCMALEAVGRNTQNENP